MPYMKNEFQCLDCDTEFEELWHKVHGDDSEEPWLKDEDVKCPNCEGRKLKRLISATGIASFSIMDQAGRKASLKKRSEEHTKKLMKKERDRIQAQLNKKPKGFGA